MLLNLASNAIKYNKANGELSISCHQSDDNKIVIRISDTVIGISATDQERFFEPFQRAQSSGLEIEGTGIGLSISNQLIKAMKGSIEVESEPGNGFDEYIPKPIKIPEFVEKVNSVLK